MTRPRKNPVASGNRTRDLPLSRRTPRPQAAQTGARVELLALLRSVKRTSGFLPLESREANRYCLSCTHLSVGCNSTPCPLCSSRTMVAKLVQARRVIITTKLQHAKCCKKVRGISTLCPLCYSDRLAGLVVKASASGAEDPVFESHLRRDFSGPSHTSDLKLGTPVATLPGAWSCRVSAGTGRPGVSMP